MIPVYKADEVILQTVENILSQSDYKSSDDILIIADSLKSKTIQKLEDLDCWVVEVKTPKRSKTNAINTALRALKLWDLNCQNVVLLDADNHLVDGFITKTKKAYAEGKMIVQCHRVAKNLDTPMAKWDAISEEINNTIFRKGHRAVGLSAALIGSGLSMDYELFKKYLSKIEVFSGFDKQLELDLLEQNETINYLDEALVLDEKVRSTEVFQIQRTRWLAAQFDFAKKYFFKAFYQLLKHGNVDYFNKYLQFLMPSRLLLLILNMLGLFTSLFVPSIGSLVLLSFGVLLLALIISTPIYLAKKLNFKLLLKIPQIAASFLVAMVQVNKAKGRFIHTPHHN